MPPDHDCVETVRHGPALVMISGRNITIRGLRKTAQNAWLDGFFTLLSASAGPPPLLRAAHRKGEVVSASAADPLGGKRKLKPEGVH